MAKKFNEDGSLTARLLFNTVPEATQVIESGIDLFKMYKQKNAAKEVAKKSSDNPLPPVSAEHNDIEDSPYWEYTQMSMILTIIFVICKIIHSLRKILFKEKQKEFTNAQRREMKGLYPNAHA